MPPQAGIESVVVFASGNWVEAEWAACALEGHEIPVFVIDDNVCRIDARVALLVGEVKVIVHSEDSAAAIDVLQPAFTGDPPFVGGFLTVPLSVRGAFITIFHRWLRRRAEAFSRSDNAPQSPK